MRRSASEQATSLFLLGKGPRRFNPSPQSGMGMDCAPRVAGAAPGQVREGLLG
jgi:hypothetical protein